MKLKIFSVILWTSGGVCCGTQIFLSFLGDQLGKFWGRLCAFNAPKSSRLHSGLFWEAQHYETWRMVWQKRCVENLRTEQNSRFVKWQSRCFMSLTFAFSFPSASVTWTTFDKPHYYFLYVVVMIWSYHNILFLSISVYIYIHVYIYTYLNIHLLEWHCIRYIGSCCSGHTTRRPTLMRQLRTFGPRLAESFPNAFSRALGWRRYLDWKVWQLFRRWHLVDSRF